MVCSTLPRELGTVLLADVMVPTWARDTLVALFWYMPITSDDIPELVTEAKDFSLKYILAEVEADIAAKPATLNPYEVA